MLPSFIAHAQLRDGSLRSIMTKHRAPELSVYALYPPTRYVPLKVRAFIDFLVTRFAGRPSWDAMGETGRRT